MSTELGTINFKLADGKVTNLNDFKGQTVLVVNVASECGLTPQYEGLEKIYNEYKSKGFTVLGFPANEFGAQEPGTNEEIQSFCKMNYGVTFPVAQKIIVKGEEIHPLYKSLITTAPKAVANPNGKLKAVLKEHNLLSGTEDEIMWNFEKFLINKKGEIVKRFAPDIEPNDAVLLSTIEESL